MECRPGNWKQHRGGYKLPNGYDTGRANDRKGMRADSSSDLVAKSASCHRQHTANYRSAGADAFILGCTLC